MAEAVIQEINVVSSGGEQAANEIKKASDALGNVTSSSSRMEEQFSHRFTHIGLQMFAGDLLRTNGLGGEARQIVGTLQTAVMGASAAFGEAAMPILLIGSALVALTGIISKVVDAKGEEAEAIQKVIDEQQKSLTPYQNEIKEIQNYMDAGGRLTKAMGDLLKADQAVAADLEGNLIQKQNAEIEALEKQRAALGRQQEMHNTWIAVMNFAKVALIDIAKAIADFILPGLSLFAEKIAEVVSHLGTMFSTVGQHVKLTGDFKQKYDELTASIAKMKLQHDLTAKGVTGGLNDMTKAQQSYRDNVDAVYRDMEQHREQAIQEEKDRVDEENARELQQMDNRLAYFIKTKQEEIKAHDEAAKHEEETVKKVADSIGKTMGSALAQSLVEGKNFSDQMSKAFQQMAIHFIEGVIEMVIEWAILKAVMEIWPGGEAAFQGSANASYPALAQMVYNSIGQQAEGGTYYADTPTMAIFGEAGPEMATFTPVSKLGSNTTGDGTATVSSATSGGSSTTSGAASQQTQNITMGDININIQLDSLDTADRQSLLRQLGDEVRTASVDAIRFSVISANLAARNPRVAV